MPIYANKETLEFWNTLPYNKRARSLAATRFAFIGENRDDKEWRKSACDQIQSATYHRAKSDSHQAFLAQLIDQGAVTIFAKLEARLILNAGDGVIENGGICLDRNSGIPYIPGSAIKAATRRWAIQQLGDCESEEKAASLLASIALIFGYGDTEWKSGRDSKHGHSHSDFWLAMVPISSPGQAFDERRQEKWSKVSELAAGMIFEILGITPKYPDESLAPQLPNLSGCIHFLPAFPTNNAVVETDVLTPHHSKYYDGKQTTATDDENPIPIFFPTVAKGTGYQFLLRAGHLSHSAAHLELTKTWLIDALNYLGLGAKTNAGYGWFTLDRNAQQKAELIYQEKTATLARLKELESMEPEERALEELNELAHDDFVRIIKNLEGESPEQQKVVCMMLTHSKKAEWKEWKKAKKWQDRIPVIRQIAKTHGIELN